MSDFNLEAHAGSKSCRSSAVGMGRPPLAFVVFVCLLLIPTGVMLHGDEPLIQIGDTFIQADDGGWTIGNDLVRYAIGDTGNGVGIRAIQDPVTAHDWNHGAAPDSYVMVNGARVNIGGAPTQLVDAEVSEWWGGVKLDVRYRLPSASLLITRSYAAYPGSSVIEMWTTFTEEAARSVVLSELTDYAMSIDNGTLSWVTGLGALPENGGAFTRFAGDLDDGQSFDLGSENRVSEQSLPFYSIQVGEDQFFGSIIWSGSWRFHALRRDDTVQLQIGMPAFQTTLGAGASIEMPHAVFGLTNRRVPSTSMALAGFIEKAVRKGRPMSSYVSYNTWYSYGTFVDEGSMLAEMESAASLGIEQFVVDAGWWYHINPDDPSDFSRNWGNWEVDPERFPNGLGALTARAHELGMRFGIWVEPERVALSTVGEPGLAKERFLASVSGRYDPSVPNSAATSAQICFADPEARTWVLNKLLTFLGDVQPDYIKWDNNFWINCNRAGHGHGAQDGNFQHQFGLQSVLEQVREAFPNIEIENCASGGNRLSLDMLSRTDVAWVDDRTDPSIYVRHNMEGLIGLLPPSYLLSFAVGPIEGVADTQTGDAGYVLRSRMLGSFGLSWLMSGMDEGPRAEIRKQIDLFKRVRPLLTRSSGTLLSAQVITFPDQPWSGWDAVEYLTPDATQAVLFAFNTADSQPVALLHMKGLRPGVVYTVESADVGPIGSATGAEIMAAGVEVSASGVSLGHALIFRAQ